jgi:hypothetical protein
MRGFEKAVADLIRGTPIEDDEEELALLRKLPLEEQLEVGFVLHEAMLQEKRSKGVGNRRLVGMRSVADARRFLGYFASQSG